MQQVLRWLVAGFLVVMGFWAIFAYGELFRAHTLAFLLFWFILPSAGFGLRSRLARSALSVRSMRIVRNFLLGLSIAISFAAFAHYERIRDALGHKLVSGYYVSYYEDTDDSGRAYRASDPHTEHWYSRVGIWLAEWLFLAACAGLPYITWRVADQAVNAAAKRQNTLDA